MKEKIKDTIVDLLFDGVKEKLDSVIPSEEKIKWTCLYMNN